MRTWQQISLQISKMLEFWKTLIRRIKPWLKTPSRLVLFLVKLLNGYFSSCFWKNSGTRCFLLLSFFFFCHSKHNRYLQKEYTFLFRAWNDIERTIHICVLLESNRYFSNYWQITSEGYLQISSKIVIYRLVETLNHAHNILRLLIPDQIFLSFKIPYVVLYFTCKLEFSLKYFVNDCSLRVSS